MFKPGEKIVCINNEKDFKNVGVTLYKKYEVIEYLGPKLNSDYMVHIINDRNESQSYQVFRFVLLTDYRKQKIEKICSKLEKK